MWSEQSVDEQAKAILVKVDEVVVIPEDRATALDPGETLFAIDLILRTKAKRTLEVGLGWGYSAAAIQAAGATDHTIIAWDDHADRFRLGSDNACRFGMPRILNGRSDTALARLVESEAGTFDLILIDGGHKFDDVFVDLHFALQLVKCGGFILLDDTWMPSIRAVCAWLVNYPHIRFCPTPQNMCVIQRVADDTRPWTHWVPFNAHQTADGNG